MYICLRLNINSKSQVMISLSVQDLVRIAPAIQSSRASDKVSKRYTFISSTQVIEDMISLGWNATDAQQKRSKVSNPYGQHKVEFRIDKPITVSKSNGMGITDDVIYPQVTFINSHDGKSSFKFYAGLFRLVCSNGLVVPVTIQGKKFAEGFKINHKDYNIDTLRDTMYKIVANIVESLEPISKMQNKVLTEEQANLFASKALAIRNDIDRDKIEEFINTVPEFTLDSILQTNRREDEGLDLWKVLNVVQEKMIQGGFYKENYVTKKVRKAKRITDMTKVQTINTRLFEEAYEIML
jgi:hypothetical protein